MVDAVGFAPTASIPYARSGGDCWTRTSDLLRVKNCVSAVAGVHSSERQEFAGSEGQLFFAGCTEISH